MKNIKGMKEKDQFSPLFSNGEKQNGFYDIILFQCVAEIKAKFS